MLTMHGSDVTLVLQYTEKKKSQEMRETREK